MRTLGTIIFFASKRRNYQRRALSWKWTRPGNAASIRSALNGVYLGRRQAGFARVICDYATFAYISDVFILEAYRGYGLSKWLMEVIVEHPELQGLRRWMLLTSDAHGLYQKVGFTPARTPERLMERYFADIYQR